MVGSIRISRDRCDHVAATFPPPRDCFGHEPDRSRRAGILADTWWERSGAGSNAPTSPWGRSHRDGIVARGLAGAFCVAVSVGTPPPAPASFPAGGNVPASHGNVLSPLRSHALRERSAPAGTMPAVSGTFPGILPPKDCMLCVYASDARALPPQRRCAKGGLTD